MICCTDDGTLKMREFYAHVSKKQENFKKRARDEPYTYIEPVVHQSYEHVSGYKSGINWFINRKRVKRVMLSLKISLIFLLDTKGRLEWKNKLASAL